MSFFKDILGNWGSKTKGTDPSGMLGRMNELTNSWYHSLGGAALYGSGIMDTLNSINSIFGTSIGTGWAAQFDPGTNYRYLLKPILISTFSRNLGNTVKANPANLKYSLSDPNTQFYAIGSDNGEKTRSDSVYAAHLNTVGGKKGDAEDVSNKTYNPYALKVNTENANALTFKLPDWGYADYINERAMFQKSLYSGVGEKGWFYFKVFFNFDTQYGLFGGLLNNGDYTLASNSAARYLWLGSKLYTQELLNDRIVALHKFASILSFISSNAPWFFKSIKNLNTANSPSYTEFSKEKSFEIEFNPDAVDMRINTMFDLYKFACFDDIGQKEIIPENLRKFDMTVVMFEAPLRYLHTGTISKYAGKFNYKTLNYSTENGGYENMMSFKMFHFMNCEFDRVSLGNTIPSTMTNEQPFDTGNASIKIVYDRVYTHTMNEFMKVMFGSDGMYYNAQEIEGLKRPAVPSLISATNKDFYSENKGAFGQMSQIMKNYTNDVLDKGRQIYNGIVANNGTNSNNHLSRLSETSALKGTNTLQDKRYAALQYAMKNAYATGRESLPDLVDAAEAICHLGLKKFGGSVLGNIAGGGSETGISHFDKYGRYIPEGIKSKYFNFKFRKMYGGQDEGDVSQCTVGSDKLYADLKEYYGNLTLSMWGRDKTVQRFGPSTLLTGYTRNTPEFIKAKWDFINNYNKNGGKKLNNWVYNTTGLQQDENGAWIVNP